jgi:hypothetical protein
MLTAFFICFILCIVVYKNIHKMDNRGSTRFVLLPEVTYNWQSFTKVDGGKRRFKELKLTWLGIDFAIILQNY